MTWSVVTGDGAWSEIERLSEAERAAVAEGLLSWVEAGPPPGERRTVAGVELFEADVIAGFRVTYFVRHQDSYVAILRVRKRP